MPKSKSPAPKMASKPKSMEAIQEDMLEQLGLLTEKIESLETALKGAVADNVKLQTQVSNQADEIAFLK